MTPKNFKFALQINEPEKQTSVRKYQILQDHLNKMYLSCSVETKVNRKSFWIDRMCFSG